MLKDLAELGASYQLSYSRKNEKLKKNEELIILKAIVELSNYLEENRMKVQFKFQYGR